MSMKTEEHAHTNARLKSSDEKNVGNCVETFEWLSPCTSGNGSNVTTVVLHMFRGVNLAIVNTC